MTGCANEVVEKMAKNLSNKYNYVDVFLSEPHLVVNAKKGA